MELIKKLLEFKSHNVLLPEDERDDLEAKIKINKDVKQILEDDKKSLEDQIKELKSKKDSSYIGVAKDRVGDLLGLKDDLQTIENKIKNKTNQQQKLEVKINETTTGIEGHENILKENIKNYGTQKKLTTEIAEQVEEKNKLKVIIQTNQNDIKKIDEEIKSLTNSKEKIGKELDELRIASKSLENIKKRKRFNQYRKS